MSMSYWSVSGLGIRVNDLAQYIDNEKLAELVKGKGDFEIDYFSEYQEFQSYLDEDNNLTFADDNDGNYYICFEPLFPWIETSLKTEKDVRDYITKVIKKFTRNDLTEVEIQNNITDVFCIGLG
ncbi:MAG: hypothetical protein R3Y35_10075 [Clostridia bacterium]